MFEHEKSQILSVFKLSFSLNQQYIRIDFKNLQELNWNEVIENQKIVYKFRIDA